VHPPSTGTLTCPTRRSAQTRPCRGTRRTAFYRCFLPDLTRFTRPPLRGNPILNTIFPPAFANAGLGGNSALLKRIAGTGHR